MFANLPAKDRIYRERLSGPRGRQDRADQRARVYALADSVYMAVHLKRPEHAINELLVKLAKATRSRS